MKRLLPVLIALLSLAATAKDIWVNVNFCDEIHQRWKTLKRGMIAEDASPKSFSSAPEVTIWLSENIDMGYASTVECADGTLLTVFYGHTKPAASIVATKWRLP